MYRFYVEKESLEELAQEKERILEDLKVSEDEKSRLHEATRDLQSCLHIIEEETQLLLREKSDIQQRYIWLICSYRVYL